MNTPEADTSFWEWLFGVILVAFSAVLAHLHRRIGQSEEGISARMDRFEAQQAALHAENQTERREFQARVLDRLDRMVTKEDLRDFWMRKREND